MTPDPLGGDITNPQSLNRYAYALNNPTTLTDPLGLTSIPACDAGVFMSAVGIRRHHSKKEHPCSIPAASEGETQEEQE